MTLSIDIVTEKRLIYGLVVDFGIWKLRPQTFMATWWSLMATAITATSQWGPQTMTMRATKGTKKCMFWQRHIVAVIVYPVAISNMVCGHHYCGRHCLPCGHRWHGLWPSL